MLLGITISIPHQVQAQLAPISELGFTIQVTTSPETSDIWTESDLKPKDEYRAVIEKEFGTEAYRASQVIECESHWDADAIGDHGNSYGLVQIHLPSHPEVTREEALNPAFAIHWMAEEWKAGHQNNWSCYKKLY